MSQVKKLNELLQRLEDSREQVKRSAEGGFLGIGHRQRNRREGGNFSGTVGGDFSGALGGNFSGTVGGCCSGGVKKRGRPKGSKNKMGGRFLGTDSDDIVRSAANTQGSGQISGNRMDMNGGYMSGGYMSGGYLSGGQKKPSKKELAQFAIEVDEADRQGGIRRAGRHGGYMSGGDFSGAVGGKKRKPSEWVMFVKKVAKDRNLEYGDALKVASKLWKQR